MKTEKKGNNWTAYYNPETKRYFAEILYISREGMEQYNFEINKAIYDRLGSGNESADIELIKTGNRTYSFENTMYGTLGPERLVWDKEADDAMKETVEKSKKGKK